MTALPCRHYFEHIDSTCRCGMTAKAWLETAQSGTLMSFTAPKTDGGFRAFEEALVQASQELLASQERYAQQMSKTSWGQYAYQQGSLSAANATIWGPGCDTHDDAPPTEPAPPPPLVCYCGQRIWATGEKDCSDCRGTRLRGFVDLDTRIAAVKRAEVDPTSDWTAWAHPGSEGP